MASNIQEIRFRRPTNRQQPATTLSKPKNRHAGILQDKLRRLVSHSIHIVLRKDFMMQGPKGSMVPKLLGRTEDVPPHPGRRSNVLEHPGLR